MGTLCNCLAPPIEDNIITFQHTHNEQFHQNDIIASSRKTAPLLPHISIPFKKSFQEDQTELSFRPKTSRNNSDQNYFKYSSTFATSLNFKEDEIVSSSISKMFSNRNSQSLDNCINNRLVIQVKSTMNQIKQDLFINSNEILLTTDILNNKVDDCDIIYDSLLYSYDNENPSHKKVVYVILYKHCFGVFDPQNSFSYEHIDKYSFSEIISVKNWYTTHNMQYIKRDYRFVIILKNKEFIFGSEDKLEAKKMYKVLNFIMNNVNNSL